MSMGRIVKFGTAPGEQARLRFEACLMVRRGAGQVLADLMRPTGARGAR
jgi:hypothetical protein